MVYLANIRTRTYLPNIYLVIVIAFPLPMYLYTRRTNVTVPSVHTEVTPLLIKRKQRPRTEMGREILLIALVHKTRTQTVQFQWKMWKLQSLWDENVQVVATKVVFIWHATTCSFGISYQYLG